MSPDGPEERLADFDEHYERDLDALDISEKLADESRDALPTLPDISAQLDKLITTAVHVRMQRDHLLDALKDLRLGAYINAPLFSGAARSYIDEVRRVCNEAIKTAGV